MGLRPAEFWELTVPDFYHMAGGYQRRIDRENIMLGTIMAHMVTYSFWNDPNKQVFDRMDFVRLPGDKKKARKKAKIFTPQEAAAISERYNQ